MLWVCIVAINQFQTAATPGEARTCPFTVNEEGGSSHYVPSTGVGGPLSGPLETECPTTGMWLRAQTGVDGAAQGL